jgi:hypothetical protein
MTCGALFDVKYLKLDALAKVEEELLELPLRERRWVGNP